MRQLPILLIVMAMVAAAPLTLMTLVEPAEAVFPVADGKIVFSSNQDTGTNPTGDLEIFTMKPDGTGTWRVTSNPPTPLTATR